MCQSCIQTKMKSGKKPTRNAEHFRGRKMIVNFSKVKICINLAPAQSLLSHIRGKTSLLLYDFTWCFLPAVCLMFWFLVKQTRSVSSVHQWPVG